MELNKEETLALEGERGAGLQKAMEILLAIGEMNDAPRLIPVSRVQISGVSYKTIGDAGIDFLRDMASKGAKTTVQSTLNPAGIDLEFHDSRVPERFRAKQREILDAYQAIGAVTSCTCTPYLAGYQPALGEHIAWAESSAVAYANSVVGARTNRESAITALASAITGKTPLYGLHLDVNRSPTFAVNVETQLESVHDYSTLGYYIGKHFDGIPLFQGIKPSLEGLKALSAGLATGKISMFHVEGVTPKKIENPRALDKTTYTLDEAGESEAELNTCLEADITCIGCPHCSIDEIKQVIAAKPEKEVWVYTSRVVKNRVAHLIKNPNIRLISDTCMVVQPLEEMGIRSLATNSSKCAYYTRQLSGLDVRYGSMEALLK